MAGASLLPAPHALDTPKNPEGPTVLQAVGTYLRPTENWIYEQVVHIERYRSAFATKHLTSLERFPFQPVHSVSRAPALLRLFDRAVRKGAGRSPFYVAVAHAQNARILHAHGGIIGRYLEGTARYLRLPLIVSFYGVDMWKHGDGTQGLRRDYATVFSNGSLFLAEGPAAAAQLVRIGAPPERVVAHRIGVNIKAIDFNPRQLIRGGELSVLMASRFAEKKGILYGVEAFCRVARDNPGMALTIVGQGRSRRDTRIAERIREIAKGHHVDKQISILGFMGREELGRLAEQCHILMHPSVTARNGDSEGGHPVVMTMLAASGMPILATRHCDIPEIVEDGKTGWLVDERDSDGLEAVLRDVLREPSSILKMGRNARALAERKYDLDALRLDRIYDRVLGVS